MRKGSKSVLGAAAAVTLGMATLALGVSPASADASGSMYCSGSQFPTLFTYSAGQIQHLHVNANNSNDRVSSFSPAGPTNHTSWGYWNSDLWYVSGSDYSSYRSVYCS